MRSPAQTESRPPSSWRGVALVSAAALLGVGVGLGLAARLSAVFRPNVTSESAPAPQAAAAASVPGLPFAAPLAPLLLDRVRWDEVEDRLAALERARTEVSSESRPEEPFDPVQAAAVQLQQDAETKRRHAAEGRDAAWADRASASLDRQIDAVASRVGFRRLTTDCRASMCVARLEWTSFDEARKTYAELLHAHTDVRCAPSITLLPPDDPARPYSADLMLDCAADHTPPG